MQYPPNQPPFQQQPNTQYPPQQPWQQPQYPPPPGTYYPPQQPMMPPPPPPRPPKKKRNPWLIIGIIIGALIICGAIGNAITKSSPSNSTTSVATDTPQAADTPIATATLDQSIPTDTPVPTSPPAKWVTTHTFSGNGNKKTGVFTVPNDWKILWSCYGFQDGSGVDGAMSVSVYNSDGSYADLSAVNATCKAGSKPTSDNTEEHQSGDVYLDINATGNWTIQIEEFK